MADTSASPAVQLHVGHVDDSADNTDSGAPPLAIRSQSSPGKRLRKQQSTASLASRTSRSKRLRPSISRNASNTSIASRPSPSRNNSTLSAKLLQVPAHDDVAVTSGDEADSVMEVPTSVVKSALASGLLGEVPNEKPDWMVRHRIFLDSDLISTTTSTQRPGYHKFQDILLREQIEIRLHTAHSGQEAHFATRHATLRFWRNDGTLAEKWMDKDMGGQQEHEFAMENMNDWTILHLSMGGDSDTDKSSISDPDSMDQGEPADENAMTDDDEADDEDSDDADVLPTMDIITHYVSDYHDARNIASAPGVMSDMEDDDEQKEDSKEPQQGQTTDATNDARPSLVQQDSAPIYHWVEERRRALEHQLREYFHCDSTDCPNQNGTCFTLSSQTSYNSKDRESQSQHLPVSLKDLTDWSQQIAHAHRSIAATTLHLAAKLADDATRAEDRRLAAQRQERSDEDDLGQVLATHSLLAALRPAGPNASPTDLEALE